MLAAALGAGAAILLAPDEGSKTRKRVTRRSVLSVDDTAERVARFSGKSQRARTNRGGKSYRCLAGLLIGAGIAALSHQEGRKSGRGWVGRWAGSRSAPSTESNVFVPGRRNRADAGGRPRSSHRSGAGRDPNTVF